MKKLICLLMTALMVGHFYSCSDDVGKYEEFDEPDVTNPNQGEDEPVTSFTYKLKELAVAAGIRIGVAVTYSEYQQSIVESIVTEEFDNVTFGNEMKNSSIVQSDGSMVYSAVDNMVSWMKTAGLDIFGHVLGWHSQQSTYYNNLVNGAKNSWTGLKTFVNFENGTSDLLSVWNTAGSVEIVDSPKEVFVGDYAMKMECTTADASNPWRFQVNLPISDITAGEKITLTFWMKAANSGGKMRVSTADSQYLSDKDITTSWQQYSYDIVVGSSFSGNYYANFDMAYVLNTYYIDNIRVATTAGDGGLSSATVTAYECNLETLDASGTYFDGWDAMNGSTYQSVETSIVHGGSFALKMDNSSGLSSGWYIQAASPAIAVSDANEYTLNMWIYAAGGGYLQYDVRHYDRSGNSLGTEYSSYLYPSAAATWTHSATAITPKAGATSIQIVLYGACQTDVYYVDDLSLTYSTGSGSAGSSSAYSSTESTQDVIDYALKTWVFNMMERYGDDMYAWDALNELFADGSGDYRTNNGNLVDGSFYWGDFLGGTETYAEKVLKYARAAKSDAVLFVNDFNLESSTSKLAGFCNFVHTYSDLIDGVATQMHISINTDKAAIDNMFVELAATGKLVRVSELDIKTNPNLTSTVFTTSMAQSLTDMYAYVVDSYFANVPESQRYGITIWGTKDDLSWLNSQTGAEQWPLLYDSDGEKKTAFESFYKALQSYTNLEEATAE